jgi:formylglycine-generating enzyme required for sulfatase activity
VAIGYRFALGRFPVTFDEYDHFCTATKRERPGWGPHQTRPAVPLPRERRPVTNVSWRDAQAYVQWLGQVTGAPYRLRPNGSYNSHSIFHSRPNTQKTFHF